MVGSNGSKLKGNKKTPLNNSCLSSLKACSIIEYVSTTGIHHSVPFPTHPNKGVPLLMVNKLKVELETLLCCESGSGEGEGEVGQINPDLAARYHPGGCREEKRV